MRRFRSILTPALALALALLSPGGETWAQAARALGEAPLVRVTPVPGLALSASMPAAAVLPAPLSALSAPAVPSASAAASVPAPVARPATAALAGLRQALPDVSKMSAAGSKAALDADFSARVGEERDSHGSVLAAAVTRAALTKHPATTAAFVMVSMVLHEIGHAKVAAWRGNTTAVDAGRGSLNPLTWGRHLDFRRSILWPLATAIFSHGAFVFGTAKPVPVEKDAFHDPVNDHALVALAGPAVNAGLAVGAAALRAGAAALGLTVAASAFAKLAAINVLLAVFNLVPVRPLDGSHLLERWAPSAARVMDRAYARVDAWTARAAEWTSVRLARWDPEPVFGVRVAPLASAWIRQTGELLPLLAVLEIFGGALGLFASSVTRLLLGAALPTALGVGLSAGGLLAVSDAPVDGPQTRADVIVVFSTAKSVAKDLALSAEDPRRPDYVQAYAGVQQALLGELSSVGMTPESLAAFNATPIASYRRINAVTISLDAAKLDEFSAAMSAQGHAMFRNDRRRIAGGSASLDELLKSMTAAANDGNGVIELPWREADPGSPAARLIDALVAEGRTLILPADAAPAPGVKTARAEKNVGFLARLWARLTETDKGA